MTENNISPEAQAARELDRADSGQFGVHVLSAHDQAVADAIVPATEPVTEVLGDLITVKMVDGRIFEYDASGFREPSSYIDPAAKVQADGTIRVTWAVNDTDAQAYEWMEGDSFETFRSEDERDEYIEAQVADGIPAANIFIVDKYDHSSVHYSVNNTVGYSDRQWDVAPSSVLILDGRGETGATISVESANATLDDYSNWANGDVYGIAAISLTAEGEEIDGSDEECWGFIGSKYAQEAVLAGGY
jgi:hypothetical protein